MAEGHLQAKLFRQQAIAGARRRALGEVVLALPPRAPFAAGVAALACILLVASTAIVRIPERIPAAGVLQPAGRIIPVLAPRAGIVAALGVADGGRVRAGERLLHIRAAGADAPGSVLAAERRSLERELAALADEAAADALAYRAASAAAGRQLAGTERRKSTAAAEAQLYAERADIAARRLERARQLHAQGGLAEHQLDVLAAEAVEARVAGTAALARRNAVDDDAGVLVEEQRQAAAQWEQRRFARERERHRLERELARLDDRAESAVLAPTEGTAGALLVDDGSPVHQGQLLLQLFSAESELQAHLYVAADHAGRVRKGQVIELRLRAWPYALYGTLKATVTAVSSVPVPAASLPNAPPGGAVYEVRARPDARDRANWPALGPGATFDVDLIMRRWPLYRWLLRAGRPGG